MKTQIKALSKPPAPRRLREEKGIYFAADNCIFLKEARGISSISRRVKRLVGDLRHRSKTRLKVPLTLVTASIVLFTTFIVGGGIYDLLDNPQAIVPGGRGWVAVSPYMDKQTINESILSMVFTVLIFVGLLSSYRSTQVAYDSKRATTMLILGIALILLGLSGSHYLLILKRLAAQG